MWIKTAKILRNTLKTIYFLPPQQSQKQFPGNHLPKTYFPAIHKPYPICQSTWKKMKQNQKEMNKSPNPHPKPITFSLNPFDKWTLSISGVPADQVCTQPLQQPRDHCCRSFFPKSPYIATAQVYKWCGGAGWFVISVGDSHTQSFHCIRHPPLPPQRKCLVIISTLGNLRYFFTTGKLDGREIFDGKFIDTPLGTIDNDFFLDYLTCVRIRRW